MADEIRKIPNNSVPAEPELSAWIEARQGKIHGILTPLQEQIIRLRYGLEDGRPRTLAELSEKFGMTRERVRQNVELSLKRLREADD